MQNMVQNCLPTTRSIWTLVLFHSLFYPINAFLLTLPNTSSQCGSYTVSWNRTNSTEAALPSTLRLIPVNPAKAVTPKALRYPTMNLSMPIVQSIPESVWNSTSQTGTYTISELPFRTGEAYIVAMDYGTGVADEDISSIRQVGSSPVGTSCLTPFTYTAGVLVNLTSYQTPQCGPLTVYTQQASTIRAFVLGGSTFNLPLPPALSGIMTTTWNVSIAGGHQFVLLYEGKDGRNASSGWIEAIDNGVYGSECLGTAPPAEDRPTGSQSRTSTGPIVGIVLGVIFIAALLVYFCRFRNWWH